MSMIQREARFFGLDLAGLGQDLRLAWDGLIRWPLLAWLHPHMRVDCILPDGSVRACQGLRPVDGEDRAVPHQPPRALQRFIALEVPEEILLLRSIHLPKLSSEEETLALELQAQQLSPFPVGDLVWSAWRSGESSPAGFSWNLALGSRALIQAHWDALRQTVTSKGFTVNGESTPEAWLLRDNGSYAVLAGFGESARHAVERRWRSLNVVLLALAVVVAGALAVTPTAQLFLRADDAKAHYDRLMAQAQPLLKDREAFVQHELNLQGLVNSVGAPVSTLAVLDALTRALPDEAALLTLQLTYGDAPARLPRIITTGQTPNAAALMQQLGNMPGFKDVKAPSPAVKPLGALKESFAIEFVIDVGALAPAGTVVKP